MRISAKRDSRYWVGPGNYGRYLVKLDGAPQRDAVEADDRAGWVIVHKRDASGRVVLTDDKTDIVTETLHGNVEIIDSRTQQPVKPSFAGILGT